MDSDLPFLIAPEDLKAAAQVFLEPLRQQMVQAGLDRERQAQIWEAVMMAAWILMEQTKGGM